MKKLIKMRFFTIKYITFLLRMTQILHIPKIIFGVSRTLKDHSGPFEIMDAQITALQTW
jgi:hypothetical protein